MIKRPGIKSLYVQDIISGNTSLSLLARILKINLYKNITEADRPKISNTDKAASFRTNGYVSNIELTVQNTSFEKKEGLLHIPHCALSPNCFGKNKRENHLNQELL